MIWEITNQVTTAAPFPATVNPESVFKDSHTERISEIPVAVKLPEFQASDHPK